MATSKTSESDKDKKLVNWILSSRDEADDARKGRMDQNSLNFNIYHLRHDFSHKDEGQSMEVLSKQSMAVETISSFFQQSLTDLGEVYKIEAKDPTNEDLMKIKPSEMQQVLTAQLAKTDYYSHVGNSVKTALLGSLKVSKVHGEFVDKPLFIVKKKKVKGKTTKHVSKAEKKVWQLKVSLIRQQDYYPDPTGGGLYEIEDSWLDLYKVKALTLGPNAIYDRAAVNKIRPHFKEAPQDEMEKNRETNQNSTHSGQRSMVKLTEYIGTVLDKDTGDVLHENIIMTMANDTILIRKPTENPFWHQKSPLNTAALLEVPHSVWHKALMDAPTHHNIALNEIYNLILDGAMKAVNSVNQIRVNWLEDPSQVDDGIKSGTTLKVNDAAPPGAKVMEPVSTGDVPNDALSVMNVVQQEFNSSALTSDLRSGVIPFRQVKATEVVEASQTITSIFQGVAKNFESRSIQKELELAWMTIAQNWDQLDEDELIGLFGEARGTQLAKLDPQDVFVDTVNGVKFRVFGITMTLNKAQDFRKLSTLLQTVAGSEILAEEFIKGGYSFGKLLTEIMTALDLDKHKIKEDNAVADEAAAQPKEGAPAPGSAPQDMSQVPQAGAGSLQDIMGGDGGIPHTSFPGSSATAGGQ